jgi:AraC-like DNA-binding protein
MDVADESVEKSALQLGNQLQIRITEARRGHADSTWSYANKVEANHKVHLVLDGQARVSSTDRTWILTPGTIAFLPAHLPLGYTCSHFYDWIYVYLEPRFAGMFDPFSRIDRPVTVYADERDSSLLGGDPLASYFAISAQVHQVIAQVCREFTLDIRSTLAIQSAFRPIANLLSRSKAKRLTVTDLASAMGCAESTLRAMFRDLIGRSPKEFLQASVIQEARSLLTGAKTVKEIAFEIGFDDEHYFSRFFRGHVGMSPTEYRSSIRTRIEPPRL